MRPIRITSNITRQHPPEPETGVRLALFQAENPSGTPEAVANNLERMREAVHIAARYQAQLCAFPECYTTGYSLGPAECQDLAESVHGETVRFAQTLSRETGTALVLPYVERDDTLATVHDSIALVADGEVIANYRKTHLYGEAERKNFTPGDELPPIATINGMSVGLLNCYECEFPPLYQSLAKRGARVIVGPTAADNHFVLPDGTPTTVPYPDATEHIIPAMASVWRTFIGYVNRRGWEVSERGQWEYRANSGVWGPNGQALVRAGSEERDTDSLLLADCLPDGAVPFSPEGDHLTDLRLPLDERLLPS